MNLLFGNFSGFLLSAACSMTSILSSPYTFWFPIVVLAAITVILIAIVIGMLAPLLGRNALGSWARIKAYEEIATVVLAIIFLLFSSMLCSINPAPAVSSIGILPSECSATSSVPVDNLWGLALCNMHTFNQHITDVMYSVYWLNFIQDLPLQITIHGGFSGIGLRSTAGLSTGSGDLYLTPLFSLLFAELMVSMLQVVLLAAAPLLFSFLIGIGLIARAFGITRTFGNAMIALGIGIGFIYPLLVSVSYGFINTTFSNVLSAAGTSGIYLLKDLSFSSFLAIFLPLFSPTTYLSATVGVGAQLWNLVSLIVFLFSIVGIGLIFIPLLNFMILDAFVVDFSSSLGQRISFMELLTNVI